MQRLKRGEFIAMSDEEKIRHKRMLNQRWKRLNPDKVQAQNRRFYELYHTLKPYICICVKCGNKFNAARKRYKLCPECLNRDYGAIRRQAIIERANIRKSRHQKVIELGKSGMKEVVIAKITGYCQRSVSNLLINNGLRRQPPHTKKKNV